MAQDGSTLLTYRPGNDTNPGSHFTCREGDRLSAWDLRTGEARDWRKLDAHLFSLDQRLAIGLGEEWGNHPHATDVTTVVTLRDIFGQKRPRTVSTGGWVSGEILRSTVAPVLAMDIAFEAYGFDAKGRDHINLQTAKLIHGCKYKGLATGQRRWAACAPGSYPPSSEPLRIRDLGKRPPSGSWLHPEIATLPFQAVREVQFCQADPRFILIWGYHQDHNPRDPKSPNLWLVDFTTGLVLYAHSLPHLREYALHPDGTRVVCEQYKIPYRVSLYHSVLDLETGETVWQVEG